MNDRKGYYKVLGLQPGSSIDEVKRAYSKLIRLYHPDHGSEMRKAKQIPDEAQRAAKVKEIEETCRLVNEAKAFLSDEKNKDMYDRGVDMEGGGGHDVSSFFDMVTNLGGRGERKRVKDIVHKVKITFRESFLGKRMKYKIKRKIVCRTCNGKGGKDCKTCNRCNGRGKIQFKTSQLFFVSIQERVCDVCNGGKFIVKGDPCKDCRGKRMATEEKIIDVEIPKGVQDEETIVFENQGDEHPEYEGGHLVFLVKVGGDPSFDRVKDDIIAKVKIDLFHALVGGSVFFKHLDDRVLEVAVNRVPNFEDAVVLKGEGFEGKRGHGDLYLKLEYVVPKSIDKEKLREVLPPTIKPQVGGEKVVGRYAKLPQEEATQESGGRHAAEGFFSEFTFF